MNSLVAVIGRRTQPRVRLRDRIVWLLVLLSALVLTSAAPDRAVWRATRDPSLPGDRFFSVHGAEVPDSTIVLLAIDGVRWREVFLGIDPVLADAQRLPDSERLPRRRLLPNLHRLMHTDGAAIGAPGYGEGLVASGPNYVSLPGYTEMLTGARRTGCFTNDCGSARLPTIVEDLASAPGVANGDVAVISSWPQIRFAAGSDLARVAVSTGRTKGANRDLLRYDPEATALLGAGEKASASPGHGDFRPDRITSAIALRYLEHRSPRFLFISLGETDEYAHKNDYSGYLRALRNADRFIGELTAALRRRSSNGRRVALIITTDHGRADGFVDHGGKHPESARAWAVASGWAVRAKGLVRTTSTRYLADIGSTVRALAGVPVRNPGETVLYELLLPNRNGV